MNIPKLGHRGGKLKMSAETLKAWLMGQAFTDQMEIVLYRLALGASEIDLPLLSAFFTANLYAHDAPHRSHDHSAKGPGTTISSSAVC
jgi:hypothetical protein